MKQSDLYPPTLSTTPAVTATDWFDGKNAQPLLENVSPSKTANTNIVESGNVWGHGAWDSAGKSSAGWNTTSTGDSVADLDSMWNFGTERASEKGNAEPKPHTLGNDVRDAEPFRADPATSTAVSVLCEMRITFVRVIFKNIE